MRLFLSSSGLSTSNQQSFLDLLGRDPKGLRVAFVPTAMSQESEESRQKYIPLDVVDLTALGMQVEFVDLEKLDESTVAGAFTPFDVIYVCGGNTFYLMHHVNRSGFRKYIRDIIEGKVYFGVSAGSVIAGVDVTLSGWHPNGDQNTIALIDMTGMSLVPFAVLPHWNGGVLKEAATYSHEIRYIKDEEAIVIRE